MKVKHSSIPGFVAFAFVLIVFCIVLTLDSCSSTYWQRVDELAAEITGENIDSITGENQ